MFSMKAGNRPPTTQLRYTMCENMIRDLQYLSCLFFLMSIYQRFFFGGRLREF